MDGATSHSLRTAAVGLKPFRDVLRFSGRSTRTEVFYFCLVTALASTLWLRLAQTFVSFTPGPDFKLGPAIVVDAIAVVLFLPVVALVVRRMHDFNWPGWPGGVMALILCAAWEWREWSFRFGGSLTPWGTLEWVRDAMVICVLTALICPPTDGPNRYGPDPRLDAAP